MKTIVFQGDSITDGNRGRNSDPNHIHGHGYQYILASEILADNLNAALPAGEGKFTKYFRVEIIEGVDSIYVADNGAGYVCVIGTDLKEDELYG